MTEARSSLGKYPSKPRIERHLHKAVGQLRAGRNRRCEDDESKRHAVDIVEASQRQGPKDGDVKQV